MAVETQEVCKICFNATSHKPDPTLISVDKARVRDESRYCPSCNQEWCTKIVTKDQNTQKWVFIRPRPKTKEQVYRLCTNKPPCQESVRCKYAHSIVELNEWNRECPVASAEQYQQPRPAPKLNEPYQMCRNMQRSSTCQYGQQCKFAHSREELAQWMKENQRVNQHRLSIRPRPNLIFSRGYKMCKAVLLGRPCHYGADCTFAHTNEELKQWNKELSSLNFPSFAFDTTRCDEGVGIKSPWVDEFDQLLRIKVIRNSNQGQQDIPGLEMTSNQVTIVGEPLTITNGIHSKIEWVYKVTLSSNAQGPRKLASVVLCDVLASEFTLDRAQLVTHGGDAYRQIGTKSKNGEGLLLKLSIQPLDTVYVKVTLTPQPGVFRQLVLFDFSSFYLVRCINVHVLSEEEGRMKKMAARSARKQPKKIDLFWEQTYTITEWGSNVYKEETDKSLGKHPLPKTVESNIDKRKYDSKDTRITRDNYLSRMHNLLYVEEYEQRKYFRNYDRTDIQVYPLKTLQLPENKIISSPDNSYYATVVMEETLFEGGRSVRGGDLALLRPADKMEVHECIVQLVTRDCVILRMSLAAKEACYPSYEFSLRFVPSRVPIRSMHQALDNLLVDTVLPSFYTTTDPMPFDISQCLQELDCTELNSAQKAAVKSMLDPACRMVPSLVLGSFGSGKTRTLCECVKLLMLHTDSTRLLICTHSNSAADLYVEYIHRQWTGALLQNSSHAPVLRMYFSYRNLDTLSKTVRQYCRMNKTGTCIEDPPINELNKYKIIISTMHNVRKLWLAGLKKGFFTHIFIDEAAQALETEANIALCLADEKTKVVLAGDHMQMGPPVYSDIAQKYQFDISLLERLFEYKAYNTGVGATCKTLLTENYRSHPTLLELSSKLFYDKVKLISKAVLPTDGPTSIPPLQFIGIDGKEEQKENSPSYFNYAEAIAIVEQVETLVKGGLAPTSVCVLAYYMQQVKFIRDELRKKHLKEVNAVRVDDVQGKEYRALLISTVRTCTSDPEAEDFLTNEKLFNTAITRARQWLIVVGDPVTLCTVGYNHPHWLELIHKCIKQQTFQYQNKSQLEAMFRNKQFFALETRVITRLVLEHHHHQSLIVVRNNSGALEQLAQEECEQHSERKLVKEKKQVPAAMRIAEERPHWVVQREEVEITEEVVGKGGYGVVKVANFRGLRVAAKFLHETILSEYNLEKFTREMTISAKLRHPNLLLFIAATMEQKAVILTELMPTSLHRELEREKLPQAHITSIGQDVACALHYLHQWKPHPIIHRDISSSNVLLEPLPNGWRAKISDYGSANFMNAISTGAPGNPAYAAPESLQPDQHSPKMDTFGFGVLMIELCVQKLPEPEQREEHILQIQWAEMAFLVRKCTSEKPADRFDMIDVLERLASFPCIDVTKKAAVGLQGTRRSAEQSHQQIKQLQVELETVKNKANAEIISLQEQLKVAKTVRSVPVCDIGTQFNYLVPMSEHLRGVHISDEKLFSVTSTSSQILEWKENGFRMQVPEGATSGPCDIAVKVIVAGQFVFPENTQLVSAVYAISSSRKLKKPVQLEIQHCVSVTSKQFSQSIGFVRADCKQTNLPYEFHPLKGGVFHTGSYYGSIDCQNFSMIATLLKTSASEADSDKPEQNMEYLAQVYYLSKEQKRRSMKFIVTKNLQSFINHVAKDHQEWELQDYYMFRFTEISLVINLERTETNGWVIIPTTPHYKILKQAVDDCKEARPPTCRVEIRAHTAQTDLYYPVSVSGIYPEIKFCIFQDLALPVLSAGTGELPAAHLSSGHVALQDTLDHGALQKSPELSDLMNLIAAHTKDKWFHVGIQLKIDSATLTSYENQHGDPMRCYIKVFNEWEKNKKLPYTWAAIIKVLETDAVNEAATANRVKQWLHERSVHI